MKKNSELNMSLSAEERAIYEGEKGPVLQKVMESVVLYGEAFDADALMPVTGAPHHFMSMGLKSVKPFYRMMDELIAAGLSITAPFTVDPRPTDYENIPMSFLQKVVAKILFASQNSLETQLKKIGLKDANSFSCTCYLPEIGNIPKQGSILCWSESSAVVYANSVLGARTNRNSAGIDFLCNILGKTPNFGLITDDGRKADWHIEIKTETLPNPQVLGSVIGFKVIEDVPYITGLDTLLKNKNAAFVRDYFKDMGAASASNGAVGLFHVENMTPEAIESGRSLFRNNIKTFTIDDSDIQKTIRSYRVLWKNRESKPVLCLIGCPHLSSEQLHQWSDEIVATLHRKKKKKTNIDTVLFAAPAIADAFSSNAKAIGRLNTMGVTISSACPLAHMNNPLCASKPVITNSNKLRTYSTARFYPDAEIIEKITQ